MHMATVHIIIVWNKFVISQNAHFRFYFLLGHSLLLQPLTSIWKQVLGQLDPHYQVLYEVHLQYDLRLFLASVALSHPSYTTCLYILIPVILFKVKKFYC